jgi:DNA-directed RNA polymerase specialized sigma24 family protein/plasmid stabilization system protein ParE
MNPIAEDILMHYGMPRRSGRYPWGSGEDPYQHGRDFLGRVDELRKQKFTYTDPETGKIFTGDTAIAKSMGLSTTQFRTEIGLAKDERRMQDVATAKSLKSDGLSTTEIGRKMGVNESTVRSWLNTESQARMEQARKTADFIKEQVDKNGMVDVGGGVERELGISSEKMKQALYLLERDGYPVYSGRFEQPTNPGQFTTQKVICKPGTPHKDIYNLSEVHPLNEENYTSRDGGETFTKFVYPKSMDSKRLMIRYADDVGPDGAKGIEKDGIVEIRRGVDDLSLGDSRYSQVRILVDDNKYIKGMAVYSDDMPDGVDVIFNTNKTPDKGKLEVLKDISKDPDNPFGSLIKPNGQSTYIDKDGNEQLSLINKRADQGDWDEWKDALPSQFLGKQSRNMAQRQLDLAKADKESEFDTICSLENPTIKKHYLQKFADECDSAAEHLQAAALPGQKYHVIIPINSLKDNEVYAPNYEPGTKLALIRYPHGGTFEIPILTVTHKNPMANKIIGKDSIDAVGINKKIADQLSGADFDGDTVMCIPTHDRMGKVKIINKPPLKDLEGFDPKDSYGAHDVRVGDDGEKHYYREGREYRIMSKQHTQLQMGMASNLITDMTLAGAPDEDIAKAVRHSMVVIDAAKHKLDYKQSELDNNIAALRKEYQPKFDADGNVIGGGGASTILSRAKGETSVLKRQGTPKINKKGEDWYDPDLPEGAYIHKQADDLYYPVRKYNKDTGRMKISTSDGKTIEYDVRDKEASERYSPVKRIDPDTNDVYYTDKSGTIRYKVATKKQQSTRMAETDDANTLVSEARHPMELIYADYANSMKSLANKARKEMVYTGKIEYSKTAADTYRNEVRSLDEKVRIATLNRPRERDAQRKANAEVASKKEADRSLTAKDIKKLKQQALTKYRNEVGAVARKDRSIKISDREWEAIQAGAISESKLKNILNNSDTDSLRERAMPRASNNLSQAKINKIQAMNNSNYSLAEIAKACGCSTSTVSDYLKGAK